MNATQLMDGTSISASFSLGLKCRAKHIVAHPCSSRNLFYASTCTLRDSNKTHLLEFKEDTSTITCVETYENKGIIRQVAPDYHSQDRFYTIYSEFDSNGVEKTGFNLKQSKIDGNGVETASASKDLIFTEPSESYLHSVLSRMKENNRIYTCERNKMNLFDLSKQTICSSIAESASGACLADVDPHRNELVASAQNDGSIILHDLRANKPSNVIQKAHALGISDLDFNPLRLYCFQTVGEDCAIKFWELRMPNLPLKVIDRLNNIPLSSKYNQNHDKLIITAFNDGSLGLYRVVSVSSYTDPQSQSKEEDGLVKIYDQHENTVYSVAWSNSSSWIFASVSYEGNVTVNMVPSSIKHRILY